MIGSDTCWDFSDEVQSFRIEDAGDDQHTGLQDGLDGMTTSDHRALCMVIPFVLSGHLFLADHPLFVSQTDGRKCK